MTFWCDGPIRMSDRIIEGHCDDPPGWRVYSVGQGDVEGQLTLVIIYSCAAHIWEYYERNPLLIEPMEGGSEIATFTDASGLGESR